MSKAEEFIKSRTHHCSNKMIASSHDYHEWLTPDQALRAVEIEREELIEKVCEWLSNHIVECMYLKGLGEGVGDEDELCNDFRKAMEE